MKYDYDRDNVQDVFLGMGGHFFELLEWSHFYITENSAIQTKYTLINWFSIVSVHS